MRQELSVTPWLTRKEWASGVVVCSTKKIAIGAWVFTVLWNTISAPLPFVIRSEITEKDNWPALIGLLFPVIGIGLLFGSIYLTVRHRKFGASALRLRTVPARPGRWFSAILHFQRPFMAAGGFAVRLSCIHRRVTGGGKNRSISESVKWRNEHVVERGIEETMDGTQLPISFAIPEDAPTTTLEDPSDRILWRLEVRADLRGVDYRTRFEVPVFVTDSPQLVPPEGDEEDVYLEYKRPVRSGGEVGARQLELEANMTLGSKTYHDVIARLEHQRFSDS